MDSMASDVDPCIYIYIYYIVVYIIYILMWNLYGSYGSFYFHLKHTQTMSNSGVLHPEDRFTSLVANICILTVVRMSC